MDSVLENMAGYASRFPAAWRDSPHKFPGVVADLPGDYLANAVECIRGVVRSVFGVDIGRHRQRGFVAVTATHPSNLTVQRLSHFDGAPSPGLAAVHWLAPWPGTAGKGFNFTEGATGTGFFRQRGTGLTAVESGQDAAYWTEYQAAMSALSTGVGASLGYPWSGNSFEERVFLARNRFNKLVMYDKRLLHAGCVATPASHWLPSDTWRGRVSINTFFLPEDALATERGYQQPLCHSGACQRADGGREPVFAVY